MHLDFCPLAVYCSCMKNEKLRNELETNSLHAEGKDPLLLEPTQKQLIKCGGTTRPLISSQAHKNTLQMGNI